MPFIHLHIIKRLHISSSSFTIHIKSFTIPHDIYYMIYALSNMAHIGLSKCLIYVFLPICLLLYKKS